MIIWYQMVYVGIFREECLEVGFFVYRFFYIYNHDGMKGLWLWEDANFSRWRLRGSQITIVELLKEMSTCTGLCGLYPKEWMIWCKMFLAMFVDTSCVKWPEVSMQLPSTHRACKFSLPHSLTLWDSYESRRLFGNHGCYDSSYVYQGILSFEYARSTAITPKQGYQPGSSFSEALHKKGQVAISKTQQKHTKTNPPSF